MTPLKENGVVASTKRPANGWCKSGHYVPTPDHVNGVWEREGPGTAKVPIAFFQVSFQGYPEVDGIYCEPCLVVANFVAKQKKDQKHGIC